MADGGVIASAYPFVQRQPLNGGVRRGRGKFSSTAPRKRKCFTLEEFWPRFIEGYATADRQKPSGIAAKQTIGRVHLLPLFGSRS